MSWYKNKKKEENIRKLLERGKKGMRNLKALFKVHLIHTHTHTHNHNRELDENLHSWILSKSLGSDGFDIFLLGKTQLHWTLRAKRINNSLRKNK